MKQLEQGLIDTFRRYFQNAGIRRNITSDSFSLGGQDRKLAADYLFYADSKFSLIEFKYTENGLSREQNKKIAQIICPKLKDSDNSYFKNLSEQCHRIAWMNDQDRIVFGSYISVVCNNDTSSMLTSKQFCQHCFNPPPDQNIAYEAFKEYTDWLISQSKGSSGELLIIGTREDPDASDDEESDLIIEKFKGVTELNIWLEKHKPEPTGFNPYP